MSTLKANLVAIALGSSTFFLSLQLYALPTLALVLGVLLLHLGLIAAFFFFLVRGARVWRKKSLFWVAPSSICLAFFLSFYLSRAWGISVADARFSARIDNYLNIVHALQNDSAFQSRTWKLINVAGGLQGIRAVKAARCEDGGVVAAFLLSTKVPFLHEGYVYEGYSDEAKCLDQVRPSLAWPYTRHLSGSWYHFSDQPGL